jgi:hypothetical protein
LEISEVTDPAPPNSALTLAPNGAQRERAIETLTRSFADDTLTMDEFERRAELVYAALTVADLHALVVDLPTEGVAKDNTRTSVQNDAGSARTVSSIRTILGSTERKFSGMVVPAVLNIRTFFGNTELDLSRASFSPGVTEINVKTMFGNVEMLVPDGARVEMECGVLFANVESQVPEPRDGVHSDIIIRVTGNATFANLELHSIAVPLLRGGDD